MKAPDEPSFSLHLESLLLPATRSRSLVGPILPDFYTWGSHWFSLLPSPLRVPQSIRHTLSVYSMIYYFVYSEPFPLEIHSSIPCVSGGAGPFLLSPWNVAQAMRFTQVREVHLPDQRDCSRLDTCSGSGQNPSPISLWEIKTIPSLWDYWL